MSGASGMVGESGFSGYSGLSGLSGLSGISGYSGLSGHSGISGASGLSGDSGISGYSGASGISGHSGISGASGLSGDSGYSGLSGISGYSGSTANFSGRKLIRNVQSASEFTGTSGDTTKIITTIMSGETAVLNSQPTVEGVPVEAPQNRVDLRNIDDMNPIVDVDGNEYYGRITEAAGVWTVTYYVWKAGAETAQALQTTQDIEFMYGKRTNLQDIPEDFARPINFSDEPGLQGYSGWSGISGYSGASGLSGDSGISGASGHSGLSGDSGISGASGYSGISGASGYSGLSGLSGLSGDSGISGWSGYSGLSGLSGTSGISGYSGSPASMSQNVGIAVTVSNTATFVVGDVVRVDEATSTYVKAQADSALHGEAIGLVGSIEDGTHMTIYVAGKITGLSSLVMGKVYFLHPTTAGALTVNEPNIPGQISKPCLVATASDAGIVMTAMRGEVIPE